MKTLAKQEQDKVDRAYGAIYERTREIHRDIVLELRERGRDPNGWNDYPDPFTQQRIDAEKEGMRSCAPSPAFCEAWRRACEEDPDSAAVIDAAETREVNAVIEEMVDADCA